MMGLGSNFARPWPNVSSIHPCSQSNVARKSTIAITHGLVEISDMGFAHLIAASERHKGSAYADEGRGAR
jgi:hypothetical protein